MEHQIDNFNEVLLKRYVIYNIARRVAIAARLNSHFESSYAVVIIRFDREGLIEQR